MQEGSSFHLSITTFVAQHHFSPPLHSELLFRSCATPGSPSCSCRVSILRFTHRLNLVSCFAYFVHWIGQSFHNASMSASSLIFFNGCSSDTRASPTRSMWSTMVSQVRASMVLNNGTKITHCLTQWRTTVFWRRCCISHYQGFPLFNYQAMFWLASPSGAGLLPRFIICSYSHFLRWLLLGVVPRMDIVDLLRRYDLPRRLFWLPRRFSDCSLNYWQEILLTNFPNGTI